MGCKLFLKVGTNEAHQIETNLTDEDFYKEDIMTTIATIMKESESIRTAISNEIIDNQGTKAPKDGVFVPNHTSKSLKYLYPELNFGRKMRHIALFRGSKYNGTDFGGSIQKTTAGKVFVLSPANIKRFSNYCQVVDYVEDVTNGIIEDEDLLRLFTTIRQYYKSRDTSSNIAKINEEITKKRKELIDKKKEKIEQIKASDFSEEYIRQELEKSKKSIKEDTKQTHIDNAENPKKQKEYSDNKKNKLIAALNEEISEIGKDDYVDNRSIRVLIARKENLVNAEVIPSNVLEFIEEFLENPIKYQSALSSELYTELRNHLNKILGKKDRFKYTNQLTNAINSKVIYQNDQIYLNKQVIINDIFLKSDIISSEDKEKLQSPSSQDKTFDQLLKKYFLSVAGFARSYVINKNPNIIPLRYSRETIADKYGMSFRTLIQTQPEETYKGHYIYKVALNGKEFFIHSKSLLSKYSRDYNTYESLERCKEDIDVKTSVELLGDNKLSFIRNVDPRKIVQIIPSPKFYYRDSVIPVINYKKKSGIIRPSTLFNTMSIEEFRMRVESTYNNSDQILQLLDTTEKAALFMQYHITDYDPEFLTEQESELQDANALLTAQEIDKASRENIEYYYVVNSSSKEDEYHLTVAKINQDDLYKVDEANPDVSIPALKGLNAIKNSFAQRGMHVELIENPEDYGARSDAKAFYKNGIIYLNRSKATMHDALHEYTHMLLGILRNHNEEGYMKILERFSEIVNSEKYKYLQELYGNLSSEELLEEAFAEEYAKFMRLGTNSKDLLSIFSKSSSEIANATIFDNLSIDEFVQSFGDNMYYFMRAFSNQVREAEQRIGMALPLNVTPNIEGIRTFIDNNVKEVTSLDAASDDLVKICE